MSPLFHRTSCTPNKSNLYLANSVAAAVSEPALYRLLTFHVPNPMSIFNCLSHTKVSVQVRGKCSYLVTKPGFRWGVYSTSPNPKVGGPFIVGCPRLLIQEFRSYPPYWGLFLDPQPEDASCRGDRNPLLTTHPFNISVMTSLCFVSTTTQLLFIKRP